MSVKFAQTAARLLLAALFILPIVFMVLAAFRPPGLAIAATLGPDELTLDSFRRLFAALPLGRFTLNSALVVAAAVPITLLTASWAGFAMARLPRPVQRRWVLLSFLVLMVPGVALWTSRFIVYHAIGIGGTRWALIAPAVMGTSPFFVLMFYRAFRRIPSAIYDSARLDGAGVLATWRHIALPIARPTALAVALLAFILYWGDYISPLLYLGEASRYTLPVALQLLQQLSRSDYPLLMAGALWASLVPAALILAGVGLAALNERIRARNRQFIVDQADKNN